MKKHFPLLIISIFISFSLKAQYNFIGSGIALRFNSLPGNYVDLGDVYDSLDFPFSVEAWVMPESYPTLYGGIFGTDNDELIYHGFWIRVRNTGFLEIEFGDGLGSGAPFKRGFFTSSTVPLNEWTHIAVTCESITDIHIYFNGVEQTIGPDNGTATQTVLNHSGAHASIGRTINVFNENNFDGTIDEIRLWNIVRSQADVRDFMCKKIDPNTSGLIGYWIADESYSGATLNDQTTPSENGTTTGTVAKITSGAPIGDVSAYNYTSNWNGVTVLVNELCDDSLIASDVTGNPYGVQVYLVDSLPYDTVGLDTVPAFYFGVFCAHAGSTAGYDVRYHYDFNDGVINLINESTATLFKRNDGSVTVWNNTSCMLDVVNNNISQSNETTRAEYILDVKNIPGIFFSAVDTSICEKFCIDFFDQSTNNPTSWEWIFNGGNPATSNQQNPAQICYNLPGVYDVTLITWSANGIDTLTLDNYITVLATPSAPIITQIGYTLTSSYSSSYQWQFNTVDIPGATDQYYTVLQSGYYTVVVSNENGCVNSFTVYILISGVDEIVVENTSMFPNPTDNQINFDLSKIKDPVFLLRITDDAGKVLMERKVVCGTLYGENENHQLKIDVSNFVTGLYFVEVVTSSQKFYSKFEVQK